MPTDVAIRLTEQAIERARTCIKAAQMRARHTRFSDIAEKLGLSSPAEAKKAVTTGLSLIPSEDVRSIRRLAADEIHDLARRSYEILDDPGPLTTVSGKLVINEKTGEPYPNRQNQIAIIARLTELNVQLRKLYGADAPKQSISLLASMSAAEIREIAAQMLADARTTEAEARAIPGMLEAPGNGDGNPAA